MCEEVVHARRQWCSRDYQKPPESGSEDRQAKPNVLAESESTSFCIDSNLRNGWQAFFAAGINIERRRYSCPSSPGASL